jgi:hypothetical protein
MSRRFGGSDAGEEFNVASGRARITGDFGSRA